MIFTARLLTPLAVILFLTACGPVTPPKSKSAVREDAPPVARNPEVSALRPSPHQLVGYVLAIDESRGFAILDLRPDAPPAALVPGAELITRTDDLTVTGRLRSSRYMRTRTLGTKIVSGRPKPGDEVVFRELKSD